MVVFTGSIRVSYADPVQILTNPTQILRKWSLRPIGARKGSTLSRGVADIAVVMPQYSRRKVSHYKTKILQSSVPSAARRA